MYRLRVEDEFSSAHYIPGHEKCGSIHGHTYKIEVFVVGSELKDGKEQYKESMLLEFSKLKEVVSGLVSKFDHKLLNDVVDFIPTAENLARYCYYYLKREFEMRYYMKGVRIEKVRIWEGSNNYCEFYEGV